RPFRVERLVASYLLTSRKRYGTILVLIPTTEGKALSGRLSRRGHDLCTPILCGRCGRLASISIPCQGVLMDLPNAVDGVVLALGQPCVRINVRGSGAGSCCPAEEVITNTFRIFWELEREVCLIRLGFAVDGYCPLEVACCTI